MAAPRKNQYARKEDAEKLSSRVWVNVTRAEKSAMVRAAGGEKLSAWARAKLVAASDAKGQNSQDRARP